MGYIDTQLTGGASIAEPVLFSSLMEALYGEG